MGRYIVRFRVEGSAAWSYEDENRQATQDRALAMRRTKLSAEMRAEGMRSYAATWARAPRMVVEVVPEKGLVVHDMPPGDPGPMGSADHKF